MGIELLDKVTLASGSHKSREAGVCAMEAVAWIAGEPHTDHPACVDPAIAAFMRSWNDGLPDDATRDRLLKPLLPRVIGTASTQEATNRRAWMGLDYLIRTFAPAFLDLVPSLSEHAIALRALPEIRYGPDEAAMKAVGVICGAAVTASAAAWDAAWDAARDAAGAAAWDAAWAAAWAAAMAAARAAARAAAWDAAWAAAWAAAMAAAWDAARDAAGAAARAAAGAAAWDAAWDAARDAAGAAARAAAGAAAGDALAPVVSRLQAEASSLVIRMCEVPS